MKAIVRRLTRLEQSSTSIANLHWQHVTDVLWERRQRRLQAEGLPFETVKTQDPPGPYMPYADALRHYLALRRSQREAAVDGA